MGAMIPAKALAKPDEPLVEVKHLKKYFVSQEGFFSRTTHTVRGVNDVSFEIFPGEAVGLVGESEKIIFPLRSVI